MKDGFGSYDSIIYSLIEKARASNQAAFEELLELYEPLFSSLISRHCEGEFLKREKDDIRQELTLAFYNSILSYDMEQKEVSFGLWAKICMNNALKTQLRVLKKRSENPTVELNSDELEDVETEKSPESELVERENVKELNKRIEKELSAFENKVWRLYVVGCTTREMAQMLDKDDKSIENAVFRIRRKLAKSLFDK